MLYEGRWDIAVESGNLQINASPFITRAICSIMLVSAANFSRPLAHETLDQVEIVGPAALTPQKPISEPPQTTPVQQSLADAVGRVDPALAAALLMLQPGTITDNADIASMQVRLQELLRERVQQAGSAGCPASSPR